MELQAMYIQILALVIFAIGIIVAISRRNLFFVLMGVELARAERREPLLCGLCKDLAC